MSAETDGFDQPQEVRDIDLAFGGDIRKLLPVYPSVPVEFKQSGNKWVRFISQWFFGGAKLSQLTPRRDVDSSLAIRHLKAILASWEPKHEHKEAGAAWLLSRWFEDVNS